jgi:hypothetical protein
MILFLEPKHLKSCRQTVWHYALQESPNERGAHKRRFVAKAIDPKKGSATGYLAKYISKNINGAHLESGIYGDCPIETAERIDTWASVNKIRQFQQIGGPSVTTWRELRRLRTAESGLVEEARLAADASDWAAFVEIMGGPFCGRNQPVKLAMWHEFDKETGEVFDPVLNKYGEPAPAKIYGVICQGVITLTRLYRWVIERICSPREQIFSVSGATAPPWSTVNNCTGSTN